MTRSRLLPLALLAAGFVAGSALPIGYAGSERPILYVVDFMSVQPAGAEEYLHLERDIWKPVHAARIERGQMRAWELYEVRYPQGSERPYDFVTVNIYDSFDDAERDPLALFAQVHHELSRDEVMRRTLESRRLLRGEIWYRLDRTGR